MKNTSTIGTILCGAITIIFIVLKLCNIIAWSWGWVLSPILIPLAIAITLGIILYLLELFSK